ncbi:MAG: hypothetical protein ACI3W5_10595 [Faecousia sp.]
MIDLTTNEITCAESLISKKIKHYRDSFLGWTCFRFGKLGIDVYR